MPTGLIYDDWFCSHDTGPNHPERPDRLRAIKQGLTQTSLWDRLDHLPFEPADRASVERVHTPAYIDRLLTACRDNQPYIDSPDSAICPASYDIALLAVGGILAAVDALMAGRVRNAFCAMRPPGHHAEPDRSMGFCLFNNAALAAQRLIDKHNLERVAVVDFDVHHGNGTQHIFEHRKDVLFISLHGHPDTLYPGTGYAHETGIGDGEGYTLNLPLAPGSGDDAYLAAFETRALPLLNTYQPQAVLISAGFDAAPEDPLADMQLTTDGFDWLTRQIIAVADQHSQGRIVSTLEGGYNLESLARNAAKHVNTLIDAAR